MTSLDSRPATPPARLVPGSRGFIATLAACMAATALAIDSALPAFGEIRTAFDLADDATSVIDRQLDGTVTPLTVGFVVSSDVAFGVWKWASSREVAIAVASVSG